jgi:hypothetical protein
MISPEARSLCPRRPFDHPRYGGRLVEGGDDGGDARPGTLTGARFVSRVAVGERHAGGRSAVLMTVVQALPAFGTSSGLLKV